MSTNERRRDRDDELRPGGGARPGGGGEEALEGEREETARLLDEVDAITRRALSGDSVAFLRAGRQQGGQ